MPKVNNFNLNLCGFLNNTVLLCLVAQSKALQPHELLPTRFLCPWNSPDKNTRVGCHALLQGIFPTQGLKPGLLHCRQILYHLSYQGNLHIMTI